jgi:hypothetical protein
MPPAPHRLHWRVITALAVAPLAAVVVIALMLSLGNGESSPGSPNLTTARRAQTGTGAATSAGGFAAGRQGAVKGTASASGALNAGAHEPVGSVSNDALSVSPPGGWTIVDRTPQSVEVSPPDQLAILGFRSFLLKSRLDSSDYERALLGSVAQDSPDARLCVRPRTTTVPNGPAGILFGVCYVYVPQQGSAVRLFHVFQVATTPRPAAFAVEYLMRDSKAEEKRFLAGAASVAATVDWKLFER